MAESPSEQVDFFGTDPGAPLESLIEAEKPAAKAEPKEEVAVEEPEEKEEAKEEEPVEEEEVEEVPDDPETKKKYVVFKIGDEKIKVKKDAMVTVRQDGQDIEVPVVEVLADYSGREARSRAWNDAKKMQADATAKDAELTNIVKNFAEKVSKPGQVMPALGELLEELGGTDALPIARMIRESAVEQAAAWLGASKEQMDEIRQQLELFATREEAAYLRQKFTKETEKKKQLELKQQSDLRIGNVCNLVGIQSRADFDQSGQLLERLKTANPVVSREVAEPTPEDVAGFYVVLTETQELAPKMLQDAEAFGNLYLVARQMKPNRVELIETIKALADSSPSEGTAKKTGTPSRSFKPTTRKPNGSKPKGGKDLFF